MNPNPHRTFTASPWRRIFCSLFLVAAIVALIGAIASSRAIGQRVEVRSMGASHPAPAQKIGEWVMEHTANGQQAEFFVVLADKADLRPAANLQSKTEKGRFVYQTLVEKAQSSQGPILQWLRERNIEHQSFYIVNAILVRSTRATAQTLAGRPDVARVEGNPEVHNNLPQPESVEESPARPGSTERPATIEPGIQYTHAPDVWALGFMGEGIVVATADSGARWTHNALKPHYRGWDGQNA